MKTINRILTKKGFSLEYLAEMEEIGVTNGCGAKGGFNFSNNLEKIPYFNSEKKQNLLGDLKTLCNCHDIDFYLGKTICDFLNANYNLACNIIELLHWTSTFKRISLFCAVFFGTTIFGWKPFNNKD